LNMSVIIFEILGCVSLQQISRLGRESLFLKIEICPGEKAVNFVRENYGI